MEERQESELLMQGEHRDAVRIRVDPRTGKEMLVQPKSFWQQHERQYRHSGQSVRTYCEQQGLALSTFRRWMAKLNGRGRSRGGATTVRPGNGSLSAGFLSVPIRQPQPADDQGARPAAAQIEVHTRSGLQVRLHGEAARRLTEALMAELSNAAGAPR